MPAPNMPVRQVSTALRCDREVQGGGVMSYRCSLDRGHELPVSVGGGSLDPEDPQPCYAVESDRAVRMWRAWAVREEPRKGQAVVPQAQQPLAGTGLRVDCPTCETVGSMKVTESGGLCEECGAVADFQTEVEPTIIGDPVPTISDDGMSVVETLAPYIDPVAEPPREAAFQRVTVPVGEDPGAVHVDMEPHETGQRDADIIAAAAGFRPSSRMGLTPHTAPNGHTADFEVTVVSTEQTPDARVSTDEEIREQFLANHQTEEASRAHHAEQQLRTRPEDQVLPSGDETIDDDQSLVIADIEARRQVGIQRYGQGHRPFNGRNTLQDAYEENLDWTVYMRSLLRTREADRATLIEVLIRRFEEIRTNMEEAYAGELGLNSLSSEALAIAAVDRLLDWHIAQRTQSPSTTDRIREGLAVAPRELVGDDVYLSSSFVIGMLKQIDRESEEKN